MSCITQIKSETKKFDDFKLKGEKALKNLHDKYAKFGLELKPIKNNSFSFYFWGLKFKIKIEIEYDIVGKTFMYGEINTYLIGRKDNNRLIYPIKFDRMGIVDRFRTLYEESFPENYFVNFYNELMKYINDEENSIKFQLK